MPESILSAYRGTIGHVKLWLCSVLWVTVPKSCLWDVIDDFSDCHLEHSQSLMMNYYKRYSEIINSVARNPLGMEGWLLSTIQCNNFNVHKAKFLRQW